MTLKKQSIRSNFKKNPQAKIIVTGCAAQIDPAKYSKMPEVAMVIGNNEKLKKESYQNIFDKKTDAGQNINQNQTILHQDKLFFKNQNQDGNHEKILVNDIMSVQENEVLVKITSAGTISIPKQFRKFMDVQKGEYVKMILGKDRLIVRKVTIV